MYVSFKNTKLPEKKILRIPTEVPECETLHESFRNTELPEGNNTAVFFS